MDYINPTFSVVPPTCFSTAGHDLIADLSSTHLTAIIDVEVLFDLVDNEEASISLNADWDSSISRICSFKSPSTPTPKPSFQKTSYFKT